MMCLKGRRSKDRMGVSTKVSMYIETQSFTEFFYIYISYSKLNLINKFNRI